MKRTCLTGILMLFAALAVSAGDNMKAFPPAEQGMVRHVLKVPKKADESSYKVEIIVGKTVKLEPSNRYFLGGKIERSVISGWGFPRYDVKKIGPMAGTLMAVDPNAKKEDRFIRIGGEPYLVRYNSRLPLVVYVPEGAEVRYKIWSAGDEVKMEED